MAFEEHLSRAAMAAAAEVCTPKQMEVLVLRNSGYGVRMIGRKLGISATAVVDRLDAAQLNYDRMLERKRAAEAGEHE